MITVTLPKHEYDKTQKDIKELQEEINTILDQKGSFVLTVDTGYDYLEYLGESKFRTVYVENATDETKEKLLLTEINKLKSRIKDLKEEVGKLYKENNKLRDIAKNRLDIIENLREEIDRMKTQHAKEIKDIKASFELERVKTKPWWKLF